MTKPFYRKYPKLSLGIITSIFLFLVLAMLECGLRFVYTPAIIEGFYFKWVDSLTVSNDFFTNDKGIFQANPNHFNQDSLTQLGYHINKEGFRTAEFPNDTTQSQQPILFIGDSFAWGYTLNPITDCFIDQLTKEVSNPIYNLGIPGADPAQYAQIAQTYIPKLKPKHICLIFYWGNDIMYYPRKIHPNQPLWHITNAGWLSGYKLPWWGDDPNELLPTPTEAYVYFLRNYSLIGDNATPFERACGQTVIATRIWANLNKHTQWRPPKFYDKVEGDIRVTHNYLQTIKEVAQQHQISLSIILIPQRDHLNITADPNYPIIFEGFEPQIPPNLQLDHYNQYQDDHLNKSGHDLYAKFVLTQLKEIEAIP